MIHSNFYNKFKIVVTGGPSSGKTTIINKLENKGYACFNEKARLLSKDKAVKIEFINNPSGFSNKIFNLRVKDYKSSNNIKTSKQLIFFDRGIHDTIAYLNHINKPFDFIGSLKKFSYSLIFILELNQKYYVNDSQRLETYSDALKIEKQIKETYTNFNQRVISVPWMKIDKRVDFIIKKCTEELL